MKLPAVRNLRTRYPDLAGVLLRDWERDGLLVVYRHGRREGFVIVAVRPQWRWVVRLLFGCWLGQWGRPVSYAQVVWRRKGGGR